MTVGVSFPSRLTPLPNRSRVGLIMRGLLMLLAGLLPLNLAAQAFQPTITPVAGDRQFAPPSTVLPVRFTVRIAAPGGAPIADASVIFVVDTGIVGTPPPGYYDSYGTFQVDGFFATVTTDANGIATAPPFLTAILPRRNQIFVLVPAQTVGQQQLLSASLVPAFTVGVPSPAIPTLGGAALALLAMFALSAGLLFLRRHYEDPHGWGDAGLT